MIDEKVLYKGWLPIDDEIDDTSEEELRLRLESCLKAFITNVIPKSAPATDIWIELASNLRGLASAYESAHWRSLGDSFYGDHLLYGKLYDDVAAEVDTVVEKYLGLGGDEAGVEPVRMLSTAAAIIKKTLPPGDLAPSLLTAEKAFIAATTSMLEMLRSANQLTPGVDNMLQGIIDSHEKHVYLLSRRASSDNKQALTVVAKV